MSRASLGKSKCIKDAYICLMQRNICKSKETSGLFPQILPKASMACRMFDRTTSYDK